MHSKVLQKQFKTAWLRWINCGELKRPTGNDSLSIANATPSSGFLQPSTPPGVMSVFFNHYHSRTSTMAQVPMLVAKSLFSIMLPSQKNENPLLIMLHLPQHSLYASKGAKITQPVMAGYELVIEKEWGCFSNFYYWPMNPAEQSWWFFVRMVKVYCSWSHHICFPALVLALQLILFDTVKEHKQAWVFSDSYSVPRNWAHAKQKEKE